MEKYYRVKNIFAENKIPYKDTSTNNQLRLSLNNVRGTNPALLMLLPLRYRHPPAC